MKHKRLQLMGIGVSLLAVIAAAVLGVVTVCRGLLDSYTGNALVTVRPQAKPQLLVPSEHLALGVLLLAIGAAMLGIAMWFNHWEEKFREEPKDAAHLEADQNPERAI